MIGSSNNSGGVVVGAVVCGTECSGFKSRFMLVFFFSFSLVEIFLSSRRISVHNEIPPKSPFRHSRACRFRRYGSSRSQVKNCRAS